MTKESVSAIGEPAQLLERDQLRHAVDRHIGDDREIHDQSRVEADVDPNRPNGGDVSDARAGRDRARSGSEIGDRREILEALQRAIADEGGIHEYRSIEPMREWKAQLDTSFDDRCAARWPRNK